MAYLKQLQHLQKWFFWPKWKCFMKFQTIPSHFCFTNFFVRSSWFFTFLKSCPGILLSWNECAAVRALRTCLGNCRARQFGPGNLHHAHVHIHMHICPCASASVHVHLHLHLSMCISICICPYASPSATAWVNLEKPCRLKDVMWTWDSCKLVYIN